MGNLQATVGIDQEMIREIVRRILSVVQPAKIILFGSAAAGTMTPDSDIDLLVVEAQPAERQEQYVRIRRALGSLDHPFDILFISAQWFEESKDVIGGIAYVAHKHGRVIYDGP